MRPPVATRAHRPTLPPPVWDGIGGARHPGVGVVDGTVDPALLRLQQPVTAHSLLPPSTQPHQSRAPRTLSNARFAGDRDLERILTGEVDALSSAHDGRRRAVGKVQQALVDLGFELPEHQVDGSYGGETEEAIRQFRAVHAPPASSALDADALLALDRAAPPPGERVGRTVDYDRLLADDRLDVTVAIGASGAEVSRRDERGRRVDTGQQWEALAIERFKAWMEGHGFRFELFGWGGVEHWRATRTLTWTDADGVEQSRQVDVWIRLVVPGEGAAEEFQEGLGADEIAVYTGHARYGSGPDFDAKKSPEENFVIGIDAAMEEAGRETRVEHARREGVAIDGEHDLKQMVASGDFDREKYRVWFFEACTSLAYLDELRQEAGGPQQLDVVATRHPTHFTSIEDDVELGRAQRFLEGILGAETIGQVVAGLDAEEAELVGRLPRGGLYTSSGFGDNPGTP